VAKNFIDATWNPSTEFWITPEHDGAASLAEGLSDFQHQCHHLALGKPVESAGLQMNLEPASVDVFAGMATELALPGDTSIKNIKTIVQAIGIIVGIASGQPIITNACLKSWFHDFVTEAVSKAIKVTFTNAGLEEKTEDASEAIEDTQEHGVSGKADQRQDRQRELAQVMTDLDRLERERLKHWDADEQRRDEMRQWWAADDRAAEPDVDCSGGS
jgi:hypothetical protein